MKLYTDYKNIEDRKLVEMVLEEGNQEALLYVIYNRYDPLLKKLCRKYYNNLHYFEQLQTDLFIHLKKNDWRVLRSFGWKSSLGTWLGMVAGHLFVKKITELIGNDPYWVSIDENESGGKNDLPDCVDEYGDKMVVLGEAISQLKDADQRFILYREFDGYEPREIAVLLEKLRRKEGRLKTRKNENGQIEEIIPDAEYIHMLKGRAKANLKVIIQNMKDCKNESNGRTDIGIHRR